MKKNKGNNWVNFKSLAVKLLYISVIIFVVLLVTIFNTSNVYIYVPVCIALILLTMYLCINEIKTKKDKLSEMKLGIDNLLKSNLDKVDIPMAILKNNTDVIWQNSKCKHIASKDLLYEVATKLEKSKKQEQNSDSWIKLYNDEYYETIGNYINIQDNEYLLVMFINRTEERKAKDFLENTKLAIGIIFIDNYEETMQGLDEITKAEIASKISNEIKLWVNENKGILTKIDKDKYVVFIEKQYIDMMENNKFNILEKVKTITDETKLPITISIGISYSEDTLNDRYTGSSSALDIALGRGGDQAVVKRDKKYEFFGGSNVSIDKPSRVRARTIAQALKDTMEKSDTVYIMGHKNTDIDCIGAAVGITKIAKSLNKDVHIIIDSKCNLSTKTVIDHVKSQKEYDDVFITKENLKKQDYTNALLVIVDTHKKTYLAYPDILDEFEKVVVIDHHRRGPEFIENTLLTYHEIYASSTCELVTEILTYLDNIQLTSQEAESLYAGIVIDTKNFTFKTGVRTFEVAAYLKKFGIDLTEVKQLFQSDFETYVAKVEIVKNAEIIDGKIALSVTEESYSEMPIIAAQAADELLNISGILASFVLCKVDNVVMISGRSMGDINVQAILEKIGGGGHLTFAGAQIAGITIEEAKEKLLEQINDYLQKS